MDVIDREQDLFAYIITEYYTPKEFYGVIINIGTSKSLLQVIGNTLYIRPPQVIIQILILYKLRL